MKRISIIILTIVLLISCTSTSESVKKSGPRTFNSMMKAIDELVHDEAFSHAHWGVLIKSLDNDEIWYAHNAERLFMPASNNKIPGAAGALSILGPDFRFETRLLTRGDIKDGVLHGDLVIRSNGDPTLYERYQGDSRAVFRSWADTLKKQGIFRIEGGIIGDDDAYDDVHLGAGWSWDYLQTWYAAQFGALQFNENYVDVKIVAPENMDGKIRLIPNISSSYFTLHDRIELIGEGQTRIRYERAPNTNDIIFSGQLKLGSDTLELSPTIHNPTGFYVQVLKETLEAGDIHIAGEAIDCDELKNWSHTAEDPNYRELAHYYSVPLSEILTRMMKRSQNMYAETMPRVIAWKESGLGTFDTGREIMDSLFVHFGIEPGSWVYADGSGLTRYNYISPQILVKILEGMYGSELKDIWMKTFPVAGEDGTLKNRMKGTVAEGCVLGKTGTISNARGLSGYAKTAAGENIVYSFLVNGHILSTKETERITDSILELICSYK
ncbi:MAG: D-alanyl-D-alanine carboxypeptidase/D-alanyl-D-alanine-endopeptidase [Fidelibacterota bacterium]